MSLKDKFMAWWKNDYKESCPSVGGQAVMEGVMMKGPKCTAITVRKPDGTMTYVTKPNKIIGQKHKWLKIPFIRGIANFILMLADGVKTITDSAEMAELDSGEPTKFEKKMSKIFGCKPDDVMMVTAVLLAVVMAIGLFILVPLGISELVEKVLHIHDPWKTVIYCFVRIALFLGYLFLCSRLKEIKRVFMYHGAEHKSIFCFEHAEELTVENARKQSRFHPRCGTSFLVIVMIISLVVALIVNAILPDGMNFLLKFLVKLLLLLPVAGISYEVLKTLGRARDTALVRVLRWPGLMAQRLTTQEPDDSMLEVALVSLKASLGWEKPLPESYYEEKTEADNDPENAAGKPE